MYVRWAARVCENLQCLAARNGRKAFARGPDYNGDEAQLACSAKHLRGKSVGEEAIQAQLDRLRVANYSLHPMPSANLSKEARGLDSAPRRPDDSEDQTEDEGSDEDKDGNSDAEDISVKKFWPGTFVSRILAASRVCPHNYVQEVVLRVMHTICLELLGWLSNCIAQRTHCECIFMFDSILPGPHNYVR